MISLKIFCIILYYFKVLLLDNFTNYTVIEPVSSCEDRGECHPAEEPGVKTIGEGVNPGFAIMHKDTHFDEHNNQANAYRDDTKDHAKYILFHF